MPIQVTESKIKDLISIVQLVSNFIRTSSFNKVQELDNMTIFEEPLVGIAAADDPLFMRLKNAEVVGDHHMTPREWFPEAKTVISYFLPFSLRVRQSNRLNNEQPSSEWLYGRIEGEDLNNAVRKFLMGAIGETGRKAMVPPNDPRYKTLNNRSSWSERHVAYIAGLGTFNLSKSLITRKGCAGRFGSIVTDLSLSPTERPYQSIYEYCNNCGACIPRCPAAAISKDGKEHPPCDNFLNDIKQLFAPRYGCGKCQTAVPCEAAVPHKKII